MSAEQRIRDAEGPLFARYDLPCDESFVELSSSKLRLRVLSVGSGPDLVMLHGVSLAAAIWVPLADPPQGYRTHFSSNCRGTAFRPGHLPGRVRARTQRPTARRSLDSLDLSAPSVVGHSLGGMFALWHAAARPGKIGSLVALGDPGAALPGVEVKMPLSILTVRRARAARRSPRRRHDRRIGGFLAKERFPPRRGACQMSSSTSCASPGEGRVTQRRWHRSCTRSTGFVSPGPRR